MNPGDNGICGLDKMNTSARARKGQNHANFSKFKIPIEKTTRNTSHEAGTRSVENRSFQGVLRNDATRSQRDVIIELAGSTIF